jgi:hypothetical protein
MTLDQVTRMKDLAYGIGGGIACFVIAYPYVFTTPKEGNPGPRNAARDHRSAGEHRPFRCRLDRLGRFLSGRLHHVGRRLLALLLGVGLVPVAAIFFIVAGWAPRKLRAAAAVPGASKP